MGYEFITQPQVFLAPITAAAGFNTLPPEYPLLTSYLYWSEVVTVPTSIFSIPHNGRPVLPEPGSFVVNVGGVLQSPTKYTVDPILSTINFNEPVSGYTPLEINFVQLATHSPSSQYFDYVEANSAFINNLTANTFVSLTSQNVIQTLTSIGIDNLSSINGFITNLSVVNLFGPKTSAINVFSPTVLRANTSKPSLELTQIASGNYFTVVTPDNLNTVFTINKTGTVGIGVSAPTNALEVSGNVIATSLSANNINVSDLFTNTATITSLVVKNITATSIDYFVTEVSTPSVVLSSEDNSKAYHFNTTSNTMTAVFPPILPDGFNVSIVNTGTGTIHFSSVQTPFILSTGLTNNTQYTGALIYKFNGLLYGVGVFE
jgi:hypothetical protein